MREKQHATARGTDRGGSLFSERILPGKGTNASDCLQSGEDRGGAADSTGNGPPVFLLERSPRPSRFSSGRPLLYIGSYFFKSRT